ncbi:hypothetical protein [Streptomyces sp. PanSC9]|uniref:hypothetical protein n=1 Tax=Streptomyces sp. PanSC9 TaxID=1520461 RepID=UPI000F9160C3|nr:hypothetical protein [Streptomyces sp. PanSC9]ROP44222.1 hypothetical protein EDD94_8010 [Streptomyces sp. PanSC9]
MAHRPYPNRDRARRQVDRHSGAVTRWASARTRTDVATPALRMADDFRAGDYHVSTR